MTWYGANHRPLPWRESDDPFAIWVSEVMLQQTQVKTVIPYYLKFMATFPTVKDLAAVDLEIVLKAWEGLGYYARARNLHKAATLVTTTLNGEIPNHFSGFLALPGVGNYIAAAVQSIAFGHCHAVVDGNVKRVLARLFCLEHPVNQPGAHNHFQSAADSLVAKKDPGTFNQAMMELGALVCTPANPKCDICPLSGECLALKTQTLDQFPLRIPSKPVPTHTISVGIVRKNEQLLITRRKLDGLLGGLWEFPGGKREPGEDSPSACIREIREETGIEIKIDSFLTRVKHAYTHFKIEMDVFYCHHVSGEVTLNGPIDYRWIHISQIDEFAFPRANLKFIPLIK
ncbi:MAG: A/G-specific adenine glycosylase [Proteobacteria bacterium]|nr:A/G-specific adenine glycosylase [Desulfobacula sp.]MBU4129998.1 A/G-specific adenine glycosylase [Pseudomonadota bacterium]